MGKDKKLVPVFMPSLSAILVNAEDMKGDPLDENEVLAIRDKASCIMMEVDHAEAMDKSRGYSDIDPENCWYDWQMLRREMGRKPDVDPGARFSFVRSEDEEYRKSINEAQGTLDSFRNMIHSDKRELFPMVKVLLTEPNYRAHMWLLVREVNGSAFTGEIFELPHDFKEYKVGMRIEVPEREVQDWMINDNGTLFGGYSLRYSRSKMSDSEKLEFDRHIGVENYA